MKLEKPVDFHSCRGEDSQEPAVSSVRHQASEVEKEKFPGCILGCELLPGDLPNKEMTAPREEGAISDHKMKGLKLRSSDFNTNPSEMQGFSINRRIK